MKTYILMSKQDTRGPSVVELMSRMKSDPGARRTWIGKVTKQCPEVTFLAHYALLGAWDFMDIYEVPDEETAAKVSMICTGSSNYRVESWTAIPEERLAELAEEVGMGEASKSRW